MCFPFSTLPPLLRVHPEIAGMFADKMDILSLSNWRSTCRINYAHGSSSLRRTLTSRLRAFVPYPLDFIDLVTTRGGIFGGELALSFVLRTGTFRPSILEIYSSNFCYEKLCEAILDDPAIRVRIEKHTFFTSTLFHALHRLVASTLIIHLANGMSIHVIQSYTCSPFAPISRAPCTALSNFVTAYSFGCSHPVLTLSRRALLADKELAYFSPSDSATLDRLLSHEFAMAVSPSAWPEYRRMFENNQLWSPEDCWREKFVCPNQGRFFGDKGSLVGYFDPLGGDEEKCIKYNVAPFGPMVIWRLMTTFECDDGCEYLDEVMDQGVTSIPVLFRKDPFGELHDCISDWFTPTAPLYRHTRRPRAYSM
ncbi:hypothetical protein GSI_06577 [Ganoderma sinense ZZ0214-1]|uniref:Uncharacterized protein n=1 Tax=Ganoderma sinense ZZ0214-1 TaxID=1077348 RepID=A0A2G8SDP5_9APHY|nr:hypothetical protein GSI_06577 [Ganoderma sinense ZZ0214-1]